MKNKFALVMTLLMLSCSALGQIARSGTYFSTAGASGTPTVGSGVLEYAYACRDASATAPTLATGWTSMGTGTINGTSTADSACLLACRVTTSTNQATNTFTNATSLEVTGYSGFSNTNSAGCASTASGTPSFFTSTINTTSTTETFNAITSGDASSWIAAGGYAPAATAGIGTAPTGMSNIGSRGTVMGAHDTNATASSFSSANVTLTTAGRIITATWEIKAAIAAAPVSLPGPGVYNANSETVTLSSTTSSPTIKYCTDTTGTCTPSSGTTYSSGFGVSSTSHVRAQTTKTGLAPSSILDDLYTMSGVGPSLLSLTGVGSSTATLIQNARSMACASSSCAVTTQTTGAGNLLIVYSAVKYSGTGFSNVMQMTAPTGTSETWTHCPNSVVNNGASSDATLFSIDCWYVLNSVGGSSSVTANWTLTGLTGSTVAADAVLLEYHPITPLYYDTGNAVFASASCSSCTGPAGILSGTSDFVIQAALASNSISSVTSYPNFFDTDAGLNVLNWGIAGAISKTSYSQPTWTLGGASTNTYYSAVAFGNNSNPSPTGNAFVDFSACTIGSAPTTTCVGSSTFSGWGVLVQDASNMGSGVTVCTAPSSNNLPRAITVNGTSYSGNGTKDLCGVTDATGLAIKQYDINTGDANEPSQYEPFTVGYSFRSSCPANVECGALLRIASNTDYAVAGHASPLGDGHWCLETSNGGSCQEGASPIAYAPNTWYRINLQMAGTTGTTDKLTICADGPGGSVLTTLTATSALTANGVGLLQIGINGEEPTTVGYNYYFRNIVLGGSYSTTACF